MNKQRRKEIESLICKVEEVKCSIQTLKAEEEDAYENLPEPLQESEKGDRMQDAIDSLDNAEDSIDEVIEYLTQAMDC